MPRRRARRRDISSKGEVGLGKLGPGGAMLVMKSGGVRAVRTVRSVGSAAVVSVGRDVRERRRRGRKEREMEGDCSENGMCIFVRDERLVSAEKRRKVEVRSWIRV